MLMGVLTLPADALAYTFAAQSIVAPFAGITLILNQVLAPCILHEKVTKVGKVASIIIFSGTTLATVFGSHATESFSLKDLLALMTQRAFVYAQTVLVLLMILSYVAICLSSPGCGIYSTPTLPQSNPFEASISARTRFQTEDHIQPASYSSCKGKARTFFCQLRPVYYAFLSGAFGAQQNVCFKAVSSYVCFLLSMFLFNLEPDFGITGGRDNPDGCSRQSKRQDSERGYSLRASKVAAAPTNASLSISYSSFATSNGTGQFALVYA